MSQQTDIYSHLFIWLTMKFWYLNRIGIIFCLWLSRIYDPRILRGEHCGIPSGQGKDRNAFWPLYLWDLSKGGLPFQWGRVEPIGRRCSRFPWQQWFCFWQLGWIWERRLWVLRVRWGVWHHWWRIQQLRLCVWTYRFDVEGFCLWWDVWWFWRVRWDIYSIWIGWVFYGWLDWI